MKKLFLLAALGLSLTACSSTTTEETAKDAEVVEEYEDAVDEQQAEENEVNGNDAVEEATDIDESVAEPESETLEENLEENIAEATE